MTRQTRIAGVDSKAADNVRQHWRTPRELAAAIVARFDVVLDAAADYDNAIVDRFIGAPGAIERHELGGRVMVGVDALAQQWAPLCPPGRGIFCNPPFSHFLDFVDRGVQAAEAGRLVLFLGQIATDPQWFRQLADSGVVVGAFSGRVKYDAPPALCDCGAPALGTTMDTVAGLDVVDYARFRRPAHHRETTWVAYEHSTTPVLSWALPGLPVPDGAREVRRELEPCAFVAAAKHGPAFPSALYILHPGAERRRPGQPITLRLLDPRTLEEL